MTKPPPLELTDEQKGRIRIAAVDLAYLGRAWTLDIDAETLRRESTILRRLLVDNDYGQCWRLLKLPGQPKVKAGDLRAWVRGIPPKYIASAFAPLPESWADGGEAKLGLRSAREGDMMIGMVARQGIANTCIIIPQEDVGGRTPEQIQGDLGLNDPSSPGWVSRHYDLVQFLDSPAIILDGEPIKRRTIISYVSNRKGGAHYGKHGSKENTEFDRLDSMLDRARDLTVPFLQLLAIGQALSDSSDAIRFIEGAAKLH